MNKDTSCATDYVVSFTIVNPSQSQLRADVRIAASNVGDSESTFDTPVGIASNFMRHDDITDLSTVVDGEIVYAAPTDANVLKIWQVEYQVGTGIEQTHSHTLATKTSSRLLSGQTFLSTSPLRAFPSSPSVGSATPWRR